MNYKVTKFICGTQIFKTASNTLKFDVYFGFYVEI